MAKMGRPTTEVKEIKLQVRVSKRHIKILENYCEENKCNTEQAIRNAIELLSQKKWVNLLLYQSHTD